jgi:selenocysteine lyase/cysteine desulfurase
MPTRRSFLQHSLLSSAASASLSSLLPAQALAFRPSKELSKKYIASTEKLSQTLHEQAAARSADELATDESFWQPVIHSFGVDRTLINLNNGGVSPTPRTVLDAMTRMIATVNHAPHYMLNSVVQHNLETVRASLSTLFSCSPEELALTRNASEALQIVQFGIPLKAGDEVITTTHDYPRMLNAWDQRARRDGIVVKKVSYPAPLIKREDYLEAIKAAVTPRTRIIHVSHVAFVTGEILPVGELCRWARSKGIQTIVDGAHALAQFPFSYADVEADYYAASLHKWCYAPIGNGMLFMRREHIRNVYPLMASPADKEDNIRKFEEIGTSQLALRAAIGEALAYNEALGIDRKAARLRALNTRWITRLQSYPTVRFLTHINRNAMQAEQNSVQAFKPAQEFKQRSDQNWCGLVLIDIDGVHIGKLAAHLFEKHRIIVAQIVFGGVRGIRITPNVYTLPSEIDRFASVMERAARGELPDIKL